MPDDDQSPPDDDKFRPDAIAARIEKFGTESEADRLAGEEEKKLLERKKGGKKGGGLETAASKRLARIGEGKVKRPVAAADAITGDPLIDRVAMLQKWLRQNQTLAVSVGVVALAAIGVGLGVEYWHDRRESQASVVLAEAMADEHGHIASGKEQDEEDDNATKALYPTFKSVGERRDAALAKYRTVESKFSGTGAAILARLAEGAVLLDIGDAKGAAAAYDDVRQSPLAAADAEVRGRAIEGKGFVDELLARSDAGNRDKHLDDAMAQYQALENVDGDFKDLGQYHRARLLAAKGDKAKAIDLLKELHKHVSEGGVGSASYLQLVVEDRLRELDPTAVPPKAPKGYGGPNDMLGGMGGEGPNHIDMSDPRIQELIRQLKEHPEQQPGAPTKTPGPTP